MPERTFRIVFPRRDNANNPIKREVLEDYATRLVDQFGGVTLWEGNGCFRLEGEGDQPGPVSCDQNFVLESVMHIDTDTGKGGAEPVGPWLQVDKATVFVRELAVEISDTLGQEATFTSVETDSRTEYVKGAEGSSWKASLPQELLADRTEMLFKKLTE